MTRIVTYTHNGIPGLGVVVDGGVAAISGPATLGEVLADPNAVATLAEAPGPLGLSWSDIRLTPPTDGAEKIVCVGINYPARAAEYKDGKRDSAYPNLFVRFPSSFVGHEQPIRRPRVSEQLDYEGEIVLVVGRGGRAISRDDALAHVGGVTIGNEGTVRDWVNHGSRNVTQGKNFDASGSIGPWVVPASEIDLSASLTIETRVNGSVRQKDSTARLLWGFPELIEYVSTFTTLAPGDLIFTGTPVGSGSHATPPAWLVPGDVVEVEVAGVGTLRNVVADETP